MVQQEARQDGCRACTYWRFSGQCGKTFSLRIFLFKSRLYGSILYGNHIQLYAHIYFYSVAKIITYRRANFKLPHCGSRQFQESLKTSYKFNCKNNIEFFLFLCAQVHNTTVRNQAQNVDYSEFTLNLLKHSSHDLYYYPLFQIDIR